MQYTTDRVRHRACDAMALLDGLAKLDAARGSRFERRLDLERVAIMGFSLGGAVAAETSTMDPRIRAAINIDGRHWGTALAQGVRQPYLFIGEELLQPSPEDLIAGNPDRRYNAMADRYDYSQLAANLRRNGGIQVSISGTKHLSFTDAALNLRFFRFARGGRIGARKALDILNAYVLAFLQRHLMNRESSLLSVGTPPYPGVRVDVWKP